MSAITIIVSEGSDPRTRRVELCNAETHIAAGDRLAGEAEILVAYSECEECKTKDPIAWKWNDPTEDARFVFDVEDLADLDREGALVERIKIVED